MTPAKSKSWFTRFAKATAHASGQPSAFMLAVLVVAALGDQRTSLSLERYLAAA